MGSLRSTFFAIELDPQRYWLTPEGPSTVPAKAVSAPLILQLLDFPLLDTTLPPDLEVTFHFALVKDAVLEAHDFVTVTTMQE